MRTNGRRVLMTDKICNGALDKIAAKYKAGMIEHGGKGLEESPGDLATWLTALQEEAIDTVMYCEKLLQRLKKDD